MGSLSRTKGANGEREVASILADLLGFTFKRDIEQYREGHLGDLVCSEPDFPFLIEVKRYATGNSCKNDWKIQACRAAEKAGKMPCVVYRFDRQKWRVSVPMFAFCAAFSRHQWADLTLEGFASLAREIMSGNAITAFIEHRGEVE